MTCEENRGRGLVPDDKAVGVLGHHLGGGFHELRGGEEGSVNGAVSTAALLPIVDKRWQTSQEH